MTIRPPVLNSQSFPSVPHATLAFRIARPAHLVLGLALSFTLGMGLFLDNPCWAKSGQVEAIHYQPEGLVIQTGGRLHAPAIETWPNEKDGVKSEILTIRLPEAEGDAAAMQQLALQEMGSHPEIKQFWISAISNVNGKSQGIQIILEVATNPDKPEFTPEVLSQGNDQWVITLQSVASKLGSRPIQPETQTPKPFGNATANAPEPSGNPLNVTISNPRKRSDNNAEAAQNLLTSLNQSRQKQAELGAQVVTLQQQLAESNAQKDALQERLNGYENILEEIGVNPHDSKTNEEIVIQNLKSTLVRVAQKLKETETALTLATNKTNPKSVPTVSKTETHKNEEAFNVESSKTQRKTPEASETSAEFSKASTHKTAPKTPANLVQNNAPTGNTPTAMLGVAENHAQAKSSQAASLLAASLKPNPASAANLALEKLNLDVSPKAANAISGLTTNVYKSINLPGMKTASASTVSRVAIQATGQGHGANTEQLLKRALWSNPVKVDNYLNLADYYLSRQDVANAELTLRKLTHVEPGGALGYYYLTLLHLSQHDRKNAQICFERYVQRNPKDTRGIGTLKKTLQADNKKMANQPSPSPKTTVASRQPQEPSLDSGH